MNKVALLCRAGFEKEVAAEINDRASQLGIFGYAQVSEQSGYVIFSCYQPNEADRLARELAVVSLVFVRQLFVVGEKLENLPQDDRISPILHAYQTANLPANLAQSAELSVQTPDTNEAKALLTFCRKFTVPLRAALKKAGWLAAKKPIVHLHVLFVESGCCYVGYAYEAQQSPFFMGIPRLKFPSDAPSRSTLKLEEAILTFVPKAEEARRFQPSMVGVDLGACPGGWTYQLVKRGLFVYAVDHGKIAASLHDTGRIEHCAEDGFKFQPPKQKGVDWLVCDMVEQPIRISQLMVKWFVSGWCREAIFNLKLPMKKRYVEVLRCFDFIQSALEKAGLRAELQAKQLYHDREEITVHLRLI